MDSWINGLVDGPEVRPKCNASTFQRFVRRLDFLHFATDVPSVSPRQGFEAEIQHAVEFVKRDAHLETGSRGSQAIAPGFLQNGQAVEVEPAAGYRLDGFDGHIFGGFQTAAQRGD